MGEIVKMKKALLFLVAVLCAQLAQAQMTPLMRHSLRFANVSHGLVAKGTLPPRELTLADGSPAQEALVKRMDELFADSPAAMAWLVWRDGRMVYERYAAPQLQTSLITTFSVSKTLTGMMVGRALCDGKLRSLDDLASAYDSRLVGTAYEKNTIRSLLTMTTGVEHTGAQGGADLNALSRGEKSTLETIREKRSLSFQGSYFLKTFNYDNTATNVLGLMLRSATAMPVSDYFSQSFYQAAAPAEDARWLRDKVNEEFAMGSFIARPRDHLRLSIHLLEILQGQTGDACIKDFAQQMVKKAVSTNPKPPVFGTDTGYGFQVWTHLSDLKPDTVELRGYGGQHMFLSPSTGTAVLVLTAADNRPDERSLMNAKLATRLLLGR